MGPRSRAGSAKSRRRKPAAPKRASGAEAAGPRSSSAAGEDSRVERLNRELSEARQQQTATADVLRIISSSGSLERVFETILENATRICEAKFGNVYRFDGKQLHFTASVGTPPQYAAFQEQRGPFQPTPGSLLERVVQGKQVIHTADAAGNSPLGPAVKFGGARSFVSVPMLKNDELVGVISIYRQEVRPFTDEQIELVKNFAAQAVIAIENARLLSELRQRTADLTESLEQQTATSQVLSVISSSPGELEAVFKTILENATRICEAKFGHIQLCEDGNLRVGAMHNTPPAFVQALADRGPLFRPTPVSGLARVINTKHFVHIHDLSEDPAYRERDPGAVRLVELGGARTLVLVPMLKDNYLIGIIAIYRQEVRPFTEKQIDLVKNFAAQAVIAIENARLLSELRQRTADLSESLEQQTATSDVLRVISSSQGELQPVFEALLANAVRLCDAKFGNLYRWDGDALDLVGTHNTPSALVEARRRTPFRPTGKSPFRRVITAKKTLHITNAIEDEAYIERTPSIVAAVELGGIRTYVAVPMLNRDELIGLVSVFRQEVCPFTDKQISLLENFAAQAVIAIENARLLNELRESLEQQTATADVLEPISKSLASVDRL